MTNRTTEAPVGAMTPAEEVAQLVGVRIGVNPCGRPCTYLSAPLRRRSRVPEVEVARA